MPKRLPMLLRCTALAAALMLAGCGQANQEGNLAALDNTLVGNDADPALTSALQDQIAVDPNLVNQSNRNAIRPPETPTQAQYPAERGASASAGAAQAGGGTIRAPEPVQAEGEDAQHSRIASAAAGRGGTACANGAKFNYDRSWANRLPAAFPVYPGGRIAEAAGNDRGDCRVRVVSFTTADAPQRVLDFYHTRAVRSGYSSEHQLRGSDHVLAGTAESVDGAYYLIVTPLPSGGSDAAIIANKGR
ncbi:MAG TPA: hypothetical protein VIT45_02475 [Allosphingosinicella sp.]